MKKKFTIEEIEATLNSLDNIEAAEPNPFFYTRLMARLHKEQQQNTSPVLRLILRPSFTFSMLALFVALNLFTVRFMWMGNKDTGAQNKTNFSTQEDFAGDYGLNTSYYTISK